MGLVWEKVNQRPAFENRGWQQWIIIDSGKKIFLESSSFASLTKVLMFEATSLPLIEYLAHPSAIWVRLSVVIRLPTQAGSSQKVNSLPNFAWQQQQEQEQEEEEEEEEKQKQEQEQEQEQRDLWSFQAYFLDFQQAKKKHPQQIGLEVMREGRAGSLGVANFDLMGPKAPRCVADGWLKCASPTGKWYRI